MRWLPVIADPLSNSESLLESVKELSRFADVVTVSGLCKKIENFSYKKVFC